MKFTMTYRTRRRLHRLAVALGYLALITVLVLACWFVWLDRYVVYSRDGAKLDFDRVSTAENAVVALPPEEATVSVHFNEGEDLVNTSTELTKISGFYATLDDLTDGVDNVSAAVKQLPAGSAVMLDLKSPFGTFYYSSKNPNGNITDQVSVDAVDRLIENITRGDYYAIARIPAFRDQYYGLHNDSQGLPHISGGYLWADEENCYWLNPTSSPVISNLIAIANELKDLGFDEVVFTEFRFPITENIIFEGDRTEAISKAAEALVTGCSNDRFAVSFASSDPAFALPTGRSRLYLTDVSAAGVQGAADSTAVANKEINLVFLTGTNDTRFDAYSVIRPMPAAEMGQFQDIPVETEVPVMTQPPKVPDSGDPSVPTGGVSGSTEPSGITEPTGVTRPAGSSDPAGVTQPGAGSEPSGDTRPAGSTEPAGKKP